MIGLALTIHGAILAVAGKIVMSSGDTAKYVTGRNEESRQILQRLRHYICEQLRSCLRPVFKDKANVQVSALVDYKGNPWELNAIQPEGTEEYKNALSSFIWSNTDAICDYRLLRIWVGRWKLWTWTTFWIGLITLGVEACAFISVALGEQLSKESLEPIWLIFSFIPAAIAVVLYCVAQAVTTMANMRIARIADKYD